MGYSIEQQPNKFTASNSPMVYVVKEDSGAITGAPKFRYIVQVQVSETDTSSFSTVAKIKIFKNAAGVGIVDIHKIVRNYLETQKANQNSTSNSIHSLGISDATKSFSQTESQAVLVRIKGGYETATSQTTSPVEELTPSGTYISNISVSIPATTPYTNTATNVGGLDDSDNSFPLTYFINDDSSEDDYNFLTNSPTVQFVRGSSTSGDNVDELTVCFKQGKNGSGSILTVGEKIEYIAIQYFNSAGTLIAGNVGSETTHFFTNSNATGGATSAEAITAQESILYFGCGTKNLQTSSSEVKDSDGNVEASGSARPSNFSNWAYYRIFGCTNHDTDDRCTKYYYFYRYGSGATVDDRHQSCTRYDNVRLAWRNRLGAWDYMNFRGKSTESVDIKRNEIERVPGTWDNATFNYNNWDSGRESLYTEANRKLTINSDWLNEDEAVWLEELFTSINVQILADNNIVYPVILTDKSYIKKTSVNDKIKIQYTINLEYANKIRTNS
tara:strand:- start:513 stop:2012 length:1500 start_codon:yes stop_codon:yes gene_type:complete